MDPERQLQVLGIIGAMVVLGVNAYVAFGIFDPGLLRNLTAAIAVIGAIVVYVIMDRIPVEAFVDEDGFDAGPDT